MRAICPCIELHLENGLPREPFWREGWALRLNRRRIDDALWSQGCLKERNR